MDTWLGQGYQVGRRMVLAVTLVALGALIAPAAVQAAANLVTIQDSNSNSKAQVDAGKLRVGDGAGSLTVDGNVGAVDANAHESFARQVDTADFVPGFAASGDGFAVPPGKILVIEHVSVWTRMLTGQRMVRASVRTTSNGQQVTHDIRPAFVGADSGPADVHLASEDLRLYADPGTTVLLLVERNTTDGGAPVEMGVSGYLVDA
jgi:hypothetical protein